MQTYDIIMLIVLAAATLWGICKGVAWQIASLASVIVGAVVAVHCNTAIAPMFSNWFGAEEPWNRFLAMLVLFVLTAGAIWIVFHFISGVIDRLRLREFDRQLGALFGLAKGVVYCVVITFFAVTLNESTGQMAIESRSGDLIARNIHKADALLPDDIRQYLGEYIKKLDEKLHAAPQTGEGAGVATTPLPQAAPSSLPKESLTTTGGSATKTTKGAVGEKLKKLLKGQQ
jgi:membrane protein required for colicin V production